MDTKRERSTFTCLAAAGLSVLLAAGSAWAVERVSATRVPTSRTPKHSEGVLLGTPGPCDTDENCDDRNACTTDACVDGACVNEEMPDCVPCMSGIRQALESLADRGIVVTAHVYGITNTGDAAFPCITDSVVNRLGGDVPGTLDTCVFPDGDTSFESWGPASAIVAGRFDWDDPEGIHIVVPIGDEGPCNGTRRDGCNDPGDDRDSIDNAIEVAQTASVIISPIVGSGADACAIALAELLADGTGGSMLQTNHAGPSLGQAMGDMLAEPCAEAAPCPAVEIVFVMDTSGSMRDEGALICGSESCDDGSACTDDDRCVDGVCQGTPNFDPELSCCNPADGRTNALSDGDPCTDDVCDEATGRVSHIPLPNGAPCDDGLFCTLNTVCSFGLCEGTDVRDCSEADDACNVGVCDEVTDQCEPEPANEGDPCDDGLFCTEQTVCQSGGCAGGVEHDCSALDEGCMIGVCDEDADACVLGPAEEGTPCDDGDICTVEDACDADTVCSGRNVNTIPCTDDSACFGASCDTSRGFCLCAETPLLSLHALPGSLPAEDCFDIDEEITVLVQLGSSTASIAGGDLHVAYDPAVLDFIDIQPGADADPESPFAQELLREIDEEAGRIAYSVAVGLGEPGTSGPAVMAAIRFRTLTTCAETELCFLTEQPFNTVLTNAAGDPVDFVPICTGTLFVDGIDPQLTCPESVTTNANAGTTRATVTWDAPSAVGGCDGPLNLQCTATNSFGVNIDHLIQGGGLFPAGRSEFSCQATDSCGVTGTCDWTVQVNQLNLVEVDVELSPRMSEDEADQPLRRCIEFAFYRNCVQAPAVVRETISFGLPFDFPGRATNVEFKIPAGQYVCATARDPLHTLRSSAEPVVEGTRYRAFFTGDPGFGGNWLINGNLNGDREINIVDFGLFMNQFLSATDRNTPCGDDMLHADINGDGIVDQLDMTFISLNFLRVDKDTCCPDTVAGEQTAPLAEISVAELRARGLGHLADLDFNHDGVFNLEDVRRALEQGPRAHPASRRSPQRPAGKK